MTPGELKDRTKRFASQIVRLCRHLPGDWDVREIAKQLLRSGTSVAANYRAACRARSERVFCSKIGVVVEESDESQLWLEFLGVPGLGVEQGLIGPLAKEAAELTAIFTASQNTAKANLEKREGERKGAPNK